MIVHAEIAFWGDDVGCFCHEALLRRLDQDFGVLAISQDLAHLKYLRVAEYSPQLAESSWKEFLRSGPRLEVELGNGAKARISRYRVEFETADQDGEQPAEQFLQWLESLRLGRAKISGLDTAG